MKKKYLILFSILCSLVFVFSSCSEYDNMDSGGVSTNDPPRIDGAKAQEQDVKSNYPLTDTLQLK